MHNLNFYTAFTDPAADYRVVTNFAGEMPLGGGDWSLRAGIRNQYDAMPAAGVKKPTPPISSTSYMTGNKQFSCPLQFCHARLDPASSR